MSLCNLGDHICEQYSSSGLTNITKALVKTTGHLHRKQRKICLADLFCLSCIRWLLISSVQVVWSRICSPRLLLLLLHLRFNFWFLALYKLIYLFTYLLYYCLCIYFFRGYQIFGIFLHDILQLSVFLKHFLMSFAHPIFSRFRGFLLLHSRLDPLRIIHPYLTLYTFYTFCMSQIIKSCL